MEVIKEEPRHDDWLDHFDLEHGPGCYVGLVASCG